MTVLAPPPFESSASAMSYEAMMQSVFWRPVDFDKQWATVLK